MEALQPRQTAQALQQNLFAWSVVWWPQARLDQSPALAASAQQHIGGCRPVPAEPQDSQDQAFSSTCMQCVPGLCKLPGTHMWAHVCDRRG